MPVYTRLKTVVYHWIKTSLRRAYTSVPPWLIRAYMVLRISYKLCAISALIYKIYLRLISTYTTADNALYHAYTMSYTSALACGHTLN